VRVCVTGGAGFIGGHLVDALLGVGAVVRVIDDLSNADGERLGEMMESGEYGDRLGFVYGSVLDRAALAEAVEGSRVVFHLAAVGSVPMSLEDPERSFAVNATGTVRVLEASRAAGAGRVVLSSSSAVYGDSSAMPLREDAALRSVSPYGASKASAEQSVRAWARSLGVDGVSLRYFNVFGPRQRADSAYAAVVPAFMEAVRVGRRPVIYGDGSASRDFLSVENAVHANLLAGCAGDALGGEALNIGCGGSTTVLELARLIARLSGREDLEPEFAPARAGDIERSVADIGRAGEVLGYGPVVGLEAGLSATAAYFGLDGEPAGRR